MGLTGVMYKRKMVQSNLKFGLNRSISWCTEVIYSPNKKAVLDALAISLDFRTCWGYILPEYYDHLFFPTLKPAAESIPTSRQGDSSSISAGSPWPLIAIGPEHTQVQERASFFLSFPSNSHFSRAVLRKKGIPAQCFSSHKSKAHPPPSGRGPDREERLEKNSQSPVVQKPWQELVGGESRPRRLGRRRGRERHRNPHVPWGQTLLERNKPAQTGLKECVGPAMTEGHEGGNTGVWARAGRFWTWARRKRQGAHMPGERRGKAGGSRCWLSNGGGVCHPPPTQHGKRRL